MRENVTCQNVNGEAPNLYIPLLKIMRFEMGAGAKGENVQLFVKILGLPPLYFIEYHFDFVFFLTNIFTSTRYLKIVAFHLK